MAARAADRVSDQDIYERYRTLLAESNWSELLDFASELQDNRLGTNMRIFAAVKASLAGRWKEAWSLIENLKEKNRVASSSDELVSNDPRINAVKKLIRLTDFGARDLFCIQIVAIVARRKRQWDFLRILVADPQSFAAKDVCRAAVIEEMVGNLEGDGPIPSSWELLLELLEANRDAGFDNSCYNLRAIKLAVKYEEEEVVLKLMEVAESCQDAQNCFMESLKAAKVTCDSNKFILDLLDKVKYSKTALSCYVEATKFAFIDAADQKLWAVLREIAKSANNNGIIKLEPGRLQISCNQCFGDSTQDDSVIRWNWILELIICFAECNKLSVSEADDFFMTAVTEAIRKRHWCVVCQIFSLLHSRQDSRELRKFLNHIARTHSFEFVLSKLNDLRGNSRSDVTWAQCCALLNCIASDEWLGTGSALPDLDAAASILIREEISRFYPDKHEAIQSPSKPLKIMKTLRKSEFTTEFLKCAHFWAKKLRCDLAAILENELAERSQISHSYDLDRSCSICQLEVERKEQLERDSEGQSRSNNERPLNTPSHELCCPYKLPVLNQSYNTHQRSTSSRTISESMLQNYCCACECRCCSPSSCLPEIMKQAADKHDWKCVLHLVNSRGAFAYLAADLYEERWMSLFQREKLMDFLGMHLQFTKMMTEARKTALDSKIVEKIKDFHFQTNSVAAAVAFAFRENEPNLAFLLLRAARKKSKIYLEFCCIKAAKDAPFESLMNKENYSEMQFVIRDMCNVLKDRIHVEKAMRSSAPEMQLTQFSNCTCDCQDYKHWETFVKMYENLKRLSIDAFHPTRNLLCLLLFPAALSESNWLMAVQLLKEITCPKDRDEKCLAILPKVIRANQARLACAILRLLSDNETRKRKFYYSKTSNLIGLTETVQLLRSLMRLVKTTKMTQCCHFRAFIGALRARNTPVILFIIRSKFRPDFTHPDILHFLSNEALCGEFELIDLIFGELRRYADEIMETDVKFSGECHDMIAAVLFKSMSDGHVGLTSAILKYADVKYRAKDSKDGYETGATLLIASACFGHHELVEEIIKLHAPVDEVDVKGRTALSWASIGGHIKTVKILVEKGAKIQHKDRAGETCLQLAKSHNQLDVLKLLQFRHRGSSPWSAEADDAALSMRLHDRLNQSGFNRQRSLKLQKLADFLQQLVRDITQEDWHMTGSYSDGVGNSLVQVNGRTAADSDIDWTVIVRPSSGDDECEAGKKEKKAEKLKFHLSGECKCRGEVQRLKVEDGHAIVKKLAGSQPASASSSCGIRPAQDICHAYACCSAYMHDRVRTLLPSATPEPVHLVTATGPNRKDEMRLSFSFREKEIMRRLTTEQGQLFVLIKFLFKRLLSKTWQTSGLKTYHARSCLFFMLKRKRQSRDWKPENLVAFLREALSKIVSDDKLPNDVFMKHFFMPKSKLYLKYAGIGDPFKETKRDVVNRLRVVLNDFRILENELAKLLEPLKSKDFHFHPFALMPLTVPPEDIEAMGNRKFARMYSVVFLCLRELHSDDWDREEVLRLIEMLPDCCKSARLCLKVMCYLKESNRSEAQQVLLCEKSHSVLRCLSEENVERMANLEEDWLWRFCFVYCDQPQMKFLPEFSRSLIRAKRPVKGAAHLYVNFRSLWWSLQAEILEDSRLPEAWFNELRASPDSEDFEELQTLAKFSYDLTCLKFCAQKMEVMDKENRLRPNEKQFLVDYLERKQKHVSQFGFLNTRFFMINLSS